MSAVSHLEALHLKDLVPSLGDRSDLHLLYALLREGNQHIDEREFNVEDRLDPRDPIWDDLEDERSWLDFLADAIESFTALPVELCEALGFARLDDQGQPTPVPLDELLDQPRDFLVMLEHAVAVGAGFSRPIRSRGRLVPSAWASYVLDLELHRDPVVGHLLLAWTIKALERGSTEPSESMRDIRLLIEDFDDLWPPDDLIADTGAITVLHAVLARVMACTPAFTNQRASRLARPQDTHLYRTQPRRTRHHGRRHC